VLTYQEFVKYRQHLEMYLAGFGLELADFGSSTGRFALAEPASEVTEADHKMYVSEEHVGCSIGDDHEEPLPGIEPGHRGGSTHAIDL
jgi:hypothetical protein